jgi:signal transduction histidine kinase
MGQGGTLTITTTATGQLTIEDTGSGMTEEQLAQAFEGPGLGLSIVRRLVTDLAATLTVDTAPGRGTRVAVTFHL